jgi:hypothetical protein
MKKQPHCIVVIGGKRYIVPMPPPRRSFWDWFWGRNRPGPT